MDKSKKMCQRRGWGQKFTKPAKKNKLLEKTQDPCLLHWAPGDISLEDKAFPREQDHSAGLP